VNGCNSNFIPSCFFFFFYYELNSTFAFHFNISQNSLLLKYLCRIYQDLHIVHIDKGIKAIITIEKDILGNKTKASVA
jgi:hypothetical protein